MRYYSITLPGLNITSYVNGQTDPGALNIEMDVQVGPAHTVVGSSWLRIWNPGLQLIAQSKDFNPSSTSTSGLQSVTMSGGMQHGLPLANPSQIGLLFSGGITQAFGNWQGTDQSLEFRLIGSGFSATAPGPFFFNWKKGTHLSVAVQNVLQQAFPAYTAPSINISSSLVFTEDQTFYYETLTQFSKWVNAVSKIIVTTPNYPGVSIGLKPNQVVVFDGSQQTTARQIAFNDLIGQMTWIGPQSLNMKTVMRGDIGIGDYVKLPPGQIATTAASLSSYRQGSVFQGVFQVTEIRHVGNYRDPSADSWCSVYTLVGPQAAGTT